MTHPDLPGGSHVDWDHYSATERAAAFRMRLQELNRVRAWLLIRPVRDTAKHAATVAYLEAMDSGVIEELSEHPAYPLVEGALLFPTGLELTMALQQPIGSAIDGIQLGEHALSLEDRSLRALHLVSRVRATALFAEQHGFFDADAWSHAFPLHMQNMFLSVELPVPSRLQFLTGGLATYRDDLAKIIALNLPLADDPIPAEFIEAERHALEGRGIHPRFAERTAWTNVHDRFSASEAAYAEESIQYPAWFDALCATYGDPGRVLDRILGSDNGILPRF